MTSLNYNTCTESLHRKCTLLQYNISLTYQSPQSLAKRDVHYCSTTSQSGMYTIAVQHRKAGCTRAIDLRNLKIKSLKNVCMSLPSSIPLQIIHLILHAPHKGLCHRK